MQLNHLTHTQQSKYMFVIFLSDPCSHYVTDSAHAVESCHSVIAYLNNIYTKCFKVI